MTASVRLRLTLAYCLVFTITLALLGAGSYLVMRRSTYAAIDEELEDHLEGVERLMSRAIPQKSREDLRQELQQHSGLKPGGDMLQVWDGDGVVVFQSASIRDYSIPPSDRPRPLSFEDTTVRDRPLRVLRAKIRIEDQNYSVLLATPVHQARRTVSQFGWLILWSIPAALVLAALGGYWMSRRALAPVDQITNAARSISVNNLSQRLMTPNTGDELQRLSETLNEMMARLESSFRKITQFTADASHELRTPIALVRTTAELALRKKREEVEYREALSQILAEAEHTTSLIENLLLLARADAESEALEFARCDLVSIVDDACRQGGRLARDKGVRFLWRAPRVELAVNVDADAILRLLTILVDNAVKYTPEGGEIRVAIETGTNAATVSVRDSGIGIASGDAAHIFERFYRADKARSRDIGGSGLGLSIAQWIAHVHHTTIQVETGPQEGSTFRITFPLAAASEAQTAPD